MNALFIVLRKHLARWNFLAIPLVLSVACSLDPVGLPAAESLPLQDAQSNIPEIGTPVELVSQVHLPVIGSGPVYYVDPSGSDENDGSQSTPWQTIQHAVNNADPGDTILIQSGAYAGARIERSGTEGSWITLVAALNANVLINSPGPNNRHESNLEFETWDGNEIVAYWVVNGLEVSGAPNWGIDIRGSEGNHSHSFVIQNNKVHNNGLVSGKSGIFTAFVDDVIVDGNESYSNGEHGIYLSNSGDHFIVRGNWLHQNFNCGLHINGDLDSGEDGIISDGLIENNRIYENGADGCSAINMDGVTDTIVRNNLLYQNHAGGISIFQENGAICSQNNQILNNTIVQAEDGRWAINLSDDSCINNKIFNNIILTLHGWRGSIVIPSPTVDGFESDYNVIMDRFSSDDDNSVISLSEWQSLGYDIHSIVASPDEVFVSSIDYHLKPGSPAIDAGLTLPGVTEDIEGTPRPQGEAYDIGVFEYTGVIAE